MAQSPPFTGQGEPASLRLAAATPRLSIVIPAVSSAEDLEQTLVSVLENRPDDCEIMVALGCHHDDTQHICDSCTLCHSATPPACWLDAS
jgi:Glycosyltransferases involved in cell wall biogenesis